jgi:hypothetical protein
MRTPPALFPLLERESLCPLSPLLEEPTQEEEMENVRRLWLEAVELLTIGCRVMSFLISSVPSLSLSLPPSLSSLLNPPRSVSVSSSRGTQPRRSGL